MRMSFCSFLPLLAGLLLPGTILLEPVGFDSHRIWMLLPLTLAVAVVYKTTKVARVRQLPIAALLLWLTILAGMLAVCVVLHLAYVFA